MSRAQLLRAWAPDALASARTALHRALQLPSLAARANSRALHDDSHAALKWRAREQRFETPRMRRGSGVWSVALEPLPLRLALVRDLAVEDAFLLEGAGVADAALWLDGKLEAADLAPTASVAAPFTLPEDVVARDPIALGAERDALATLAAWFDLAHAGLVAFEAEAEAAARPAEPSPVRVWPHHFDIAAYVALEAGDPETARGVGLGLSPGDDMIASPYFYVAPWPRIAGAPPELPQPAFWREDGFVGALLASGDLLGAAAEADDAGLEARVGAFFSAAFAASRARLGA